MALNMRTSQAGLDLIKAFEGFRARSELLPNGRWMVGYGHVRRAKKGVRVNKTEAEAILREYDLPPVERFVMRCVLAPMTQNEFDALVSLAFNIGPKAFSGSDVVAGMNAGNRLEAAAAFDLWRRAKIGGRVQIVDALVRRRAAEKALFLNAPGRLPIASSRLYRAMHDADALPAPPPQREILVEHHSAPEIAALPEVDDGETMRTATEAAAESVRQQMVRILGEEEATAQTEIAPDEGGTTAEEIAAAISELAGETAPLSVTKSVWPSRTDLPEVSDEPAPRTSAEPSVAHLEPIEGSDVIDDLEPVEVSVESIERAVELNQTIDAEDRRGTFLNALPFGLLTLIGAALGGYGLASQFGIIQSDQTVETPMAVFMPPFLILLGILLFGVMAYYFVRSLSSRD
ncbi:MAG: glycoside hydrolase family protein [Pseudomonadota bacterium]